METKPLGGIGSGNTYQPRKKRTTDECNSVDVRTLYRKGHLKPGHRFSLSWSRGERETGSIGGVVHGDQTRNRPSQVVLIYRHRVNGDEWENTREQVEITWTACNFGGERPWFVCPSVVNGVSCGRKVAVLYGLERYFLCRHCYDLNYESQRKDSSHRALHRAQQIRRRLGGSANMTLPFPERPKGMHHKTYIRLWYEHEIAYGAYARSMREHIDKFWEQFGRRFPEL